MSNRSGFAASRALTRGCLLGLALFGLALGQPGSIITFDVPGAGTGFRQGTTATSINAAGVITLVTTITASCEAPTAFLRFSTPPAPAQGPLPRASTTTAPSQDTTSTRMGWITALSGVHREL